MGGGHSLDRTMCRSLNIILNSAVLTYCSLLSIIEEYQIAQHSFIIVENFELVCNNCACGGQPEIDYKDLGNLNGGADECFGIAKTNSFCGRMIIVHFDYGRCYCRVIGKESSCSKKQFPGHNWSVYQLGEQTNANKKNLLLYLLSSITYLYYLDYYLFLYLLTVSELTITTIDDTTPDTGKTSSYNYVKSTKARIKRKIILIAYFAHFMLRGVD